MSQRNISSAIYMLFGLSVLGCYKLPVEKGRPHLSYLTEWKKVVGEKIDREASFVPHCCPISLADWKAYGEDLKNDYLLPYGHRKVLSIVDSLRAVVPFSIKNDKIIIMENYQQGFNFWHSTSILIYQKRRNKVVGIKINKTSPDSRDVIYETKGMDTSTEAISENGRRYLKTYFEASSNCENGFLIVTVLNAEYNIEKCHVAIMPHF
jgi:hypothetical protein